MRGVDGGGLQILRSAGNDIGGPVASVAVSVLVNCSFSKLHYSYDRQKWGRQTETLY
jgi:hypothetical protein